MGHPRVNTTYCVGFLWNDKLATCQVPPEAGRERIKNIAAGVVDAILFDHPCNPVVHEVNPASKGFLTD